MDITVRVEVQYVAPDRALVRDVLHMFRTPAWVRFMVRYISPHLKNAAPADKSVVDALAGWRIRSGASALSCNDSDGCSSACVICMSDVSAAASISGTSEQEQQEQESTAVRLPCGHCFHHGCIQSWLKLRSTCPSCRFQFRKAFSGSYAVKTLNSALLLKPEHRFQSKETILDSCVGKETVRAVVNVTLSQIASQTKRSQYPCVLNALMMHSNGDSFSEAAPAVDKAVDSAATSAAARSRAVSAGSASAAASSSAAMGSSASSGLVRRADEMCAASGSNSPCELESEHHRRSCKRVRVH